MGYDELRPRIDEAVKTDPVFRFFAFHRTILPSACDNQRVVVCVTTKIYCGAIGSAHVVGWSTDLPSSFGVTKESRAKLTQRVAGLAC